MKLRWTEGAARQLEEIFDYIAQDNVEAARDTIRRIAGLVDQIALFPRAGRRGPRPGTLERVVAGLPYIVVYRIQGDVVEVLRVFHGARRQPQREPS